MSRPVERSENLLVLSSEHGSNRIPASYRSLFNEADSVLQTHRGWDIGSADLARYLAKTLTAPLERARVSRLLVDCNRSPRHRQLFSQYTRELPTDTRESILEQYYYPYRNRIEALIKDQLIKNKIVVHVSVHSFVPELNGKKRNADIGLLYDPGRAGELEFCRHWQQRLKQSNDALKVRRNYPYKGISDGLVTHLRKIFSPKNYIAVELEFRHDWFGTKPDEWAGFRKTLANTLGDALDASAPGA